MYKAATSNQISAITTTTGSLTTLNATPSDWYYNATVWANNQGYLASVPDFSNGFLPDSTTSRGLAMYLFWEMKTGNSCVFIEVDSGTGINVVTLSGRTDNYVSGYYKKGMTLSVSCIPSNEYIFLKWIENDYPIAYNNPTAMAVNGNRSWTAVARPMTNRERMVEYAENELGNHQADNPGYNINGHWCAAFSSWCAYAADLASNTNTSLYFYNGIWQYFFSSDVANENFTNPLSYYFQVLRNNVCAQQIAHFCRTDQMYVTKNDYICCTSRTRNLDWTDAILIGASFAPHVGDFVFFDWVTPSEYADHVGIVISASRVGQKITITVIEGNTNGTGSGSDYYNSSVVGTHTYSFYLDNDSKLFYANGSLRGYILGFARIT